MSERRHCNLIRVICPWLQRMKRALLIARLAVLPSVLIAAMLLTFVYFPSFNPLLPPVIALGLLLITRSALLSLFVAGVFGVFLLQDAQLAAVPASWWQDHLVPSLSGRWHIAALVFTLELAFFATLLERTGALAHLVQRWCHIDSANEKVGSRLQLSLVGLGFLCFFDGLANSLIVGRVGSPLADRARVSREKLAYLVDTTSSAVACVAFLSTWTVTQLSYISTELADSPFETPAYTLFLKSIPANFYCLASIFLVILASWWNWNPPPMNKTAPRKLTPLQAELPPPKFRGPILLLMAFGPIAILLLSVPFSFWIFGGDGPYPTSIESIQQAFNTSRGPDALMLSGAISIIGVLLLGGGKAWKSILAAFKALLPVLPALTVLILAWILSSTLKELQTGNLLAAHLGDRFPLTLLPLGIFLVACLTSFFTGTSWGTMGLMMPIALGTFLSILKLQDLSPLEYDHLLPLIIGAVFGGAVFGDHASPFSDTTIISALACDIKTTTHVFTQLPYALLAAAASMLIGYLPIFFRVPTIVCLAGVLLAVLIFVLLTKAKYSENPE